MIRRNHDYNPPLVALLMILVALALFGVLCTSTDAGCAEPSEALTELVADDTATVDRVDAAIIWLLRKAPHWYLSVKHTERREMAEQIVIAARKHDVPPLLVTVTVKRESSFKPNATGALGEVGLMQVWSKAARNCELKTVAGQLDCGARWLRKAYDVCGTWEQAMTVYMSGECNTKSIAVRKSVLSRLRQWKRLEKVTATVEHADNAQ